MGLASSRPHNPRLRAVRTYPMPDSIAGSATVDPEAECGGGIAAGAMIVDSNPDDFVPPILDSDKELADTGNVLMNLEADAADAKPDKEAEPGADADSVPDKDDVDPVAREKADEAMEALLASPVVQKSRKPSPKNKHLHVKKASRDEKSAREKKSPQEKRSAQGDEKMSSREKELAAMEKKLAAQTKQMEARTKQLEAKLQAQTKKLEAKEKKATAALEKKKAALEKKEATLEKRASQEKKLAPKKKPAVKKTGLRDEGSDGDVPLDALVGRKTTASAKGKNTGPKASIGKASPVEKTKGKKLVPKDKENGNAVSEKAKGGKKTGKKELGIKRKTPASGQENVTPASKKAKLVLKNEKGSKSALMKKRSPAVKKGNVVKKAKVAKKEEPGDSDDEEGVILSDEEGEESESEDGEDGEEDVSEPSQTKSQKGGEGIACSSSDIDALDMVAAACKQLRGFTSSSAEHASVFVRSPNAKRTPALLLAIARGIPVLTINWLVDSISSGRFIKDISKYESHEGAKASRKLKTSTNSAGFLRRTRVKIVGKPIADTKLLESIIVASGGRLVSRNEEFSIIDTTSPVANHKNPVKLAFLADAVEQQRMLDWGDYLVA